MPLSNVVAVRTSHPLAPFVRGAVRLDEQPDGFVIPQRFFPEQLEHFDGIGRHERAVATAGVVISFATDGTEVSLDCRIVRPLNEQHVLYRAVMDPAGIGDAFGGHLVSSTASRRYGAAEEGNVDGIDLVVDGNHIGTVAPTNGTLRFAFPNLLHEELEVRIYLPSIMCVAIGNLHTNGSLKPVPARGYLLALGDSITQGFVCGMPSLSYPAQIASTLGLDLINQSVAGHTFDEQSLGGFSLWRGEQPQVIVVAYGTNDWSHKRTTEAIEGDAVAYFDRLSWYFPKVPIYVLSPLWRADEHDPMSCGQPLTWMHQLLGRVCSLHHNMHVVDGYHGIPKDPSLFADGVLHPGPKCMGLVADLLLEAMCADSVDLLVAKSVAKRLASGEALVSDVASGFISREERIDRQTALREDSPETHPEFDRLVRTIWRLRQPDGCPWDKEQTHQSITRNMVEEAYEAVEAIEQHAAAKATAMASESAGLVREANAHLCEELGDVLEQVLLHAQIASDENDFAIDDICRDLNAKLVRRHPHVFGDAGMPEPVDGGAATADEALDRWDEVKAAERAAKGEVTCEPGLLDSIPRSLPALMQAQKISTRAAKAGFEWDTVDDIWEQVAEERREFEREEPNTDAAMREFGDILFALVNVARRCGIDAEEALAASNAKFRRRWAAMESRADLAKLDTVGLNRLWDEVKAQE